MTHAIRISESRRSRGVAIARALDLCAASPRRMGGED
jgi:hypothetical protein